MVRSIFCFLVYLSVGCPQTVTFHGEGLPDSLVARIQVRDRFLSELATSPNGVAPQYVVETLKRWSPGSTVRIAFSGGDNALRKNVSDAANVWLADGGGNLKLDFGYNAASQSYRSWHASDTTPVSEIRISFDRAGYWSLVGGDSMDAMIVGPGEPSMNLGGFTISRPVDWQAVVAHEFGHALGFQHEHQSPIGGCDAQFRWFDDPGYMPTHDQFGQYIVDSAGRRPGIYTVLGGPPNNWPSSKVDFNLKQLPNSSAFSVGPFDRKSIMMYAFPSWMFVSPNSPCFTPENLVLSAQDRAGFVQTYPFAPADVTRLLEQRRVFIEAVLKSKVPSSVTDRFKAMANAQ